MSSLFQETGVKVEIRFNNEIPEQFFWFNEPECRIVNGTLEIRTRGNTDFWQTTHYGFNRDNGHCLLTRVDYDFSLEVRTLFTYQGQYDQCGLIVRIDAENWIKVSVERENDRLSRLGSVVTNLGFSDWATKDIEEPVYHMRYRMQKSGKDFLIETSGDETTWQQMRIAHLHKPFTSMDIGVYACSPEESSFTAKFNNLVIDESTWI